MTDLIEYSDHKEIVRPLSKINKDASITPYVPLPVIAGVQVVHNEVDAARLIASFAKRLKLGPDYLESDDDLRCIELAIIEGTEWQPVIGWGRNDYCGDDYDFAQINHRYGRGAVDSALLILFEILEGPL